MSLIGNYTTLNANQVHFEIGNNILPATPTKKT